MSKIEEMENYLPPFLTKIREMSEILQAEAPEFEQQNNDIFDLTDQLFITTATWGLDRWEALLNVVKEPGDSMKIRRLKLSSKTSNIPPATYQAIEQALNRFLKNPSSRVRLLPKEYRFNVDIDIDDLQNVRELIETLENMKPAHLAYTFRPGFNEQLKIKDTVTMNHRRYRKIKELRVGYSVTLDNNEVVLT
ncbi:putative phage tail protein [Bacillus swezeyi]|uniref:putative phage tail protein n=1 Tax=Bacillus swezeyi TaxID=1925020 RepID=UPI003F8B11A3